MAKAPTIVIADCTIKSNGRYHAPGSLVEISTKKEAVDLVRQGFAHFPKDKEEAAGAQTSGFEIP